VSLWAPTFSASPLSIPIDTSRGFVTLIASPVTSRAHTRNPMYNTCDARDNISLRSFPRSFAGKLQIGDFSLMVTTIDSITQELAMSMLNQYFLVDDTMLSAHNRERNKYASGPCHGEVRAFKLPD